MLRKAPELPSVVIDQPVITPEQEQEKWLGEALIKLKERSMHLRKAMETDAIYEVLRWASALLSELRTNLLTPQNYYEVYMKTFDVLLELEAYFLSEVQKGRKAGELYEVVQYAGNVVPRIYLLITIGSVYIQTKQANAKDILKDLVEMCKGVQNPTRGLFLRNYLSQLTKNKLPDEYEEGNEYAGKGGSVEDSVAFILQNFREMTWLWVRMGVKNVMGNVQKREKERKELRLLVGFNLVRLSQLDGVTKKYYKSFVLPQVLDIICAFEDGTAQQYLYECVIQVFPDEYHIATLDQLLGALAKLTDAVALQPLLCSLMNRLASFALRVREGDESIKLRSAETATLQDMFRIFHEKIGQLGREGRFGQSAFAQTHLSLLSLVLKAYTWEKNRVDDLTQSMVEYFHRTAPDSEAVRVIRELLERITVEIPHVVETLDLVHYKDLMDTLPFHPRREVALAVARSVICCNQPISTLDRTTRLLDMLAPLMYDVADRPSNADSVYLMSPEEEFEEEQHLVCKMMHSIENKEDYALTLKLLSLVRKEVGRGGEERMKHTLIALTNALLRFAIRVRKAEAAEVATGVRIEKIFGYLHSNGSGKGLLEMLARDVPYTAMQLYLKSGNTADVCGLAETAYELFGEAFLLYEERCPDSKVQVRFLDSMVSSLCLVSSLSMEHFEILSMKVCQYSSKLLRRPDQCRAVTTCSHVFASKLLPDADPSFRKKILDCLQRGLKVVHQCPRSQQTPLLVELLNHYAYYFQTETPNVGAKYINTLLELIDKEQASEAEGGNANRDGSDEESDDDMPPIRKLDVKGGGKNASATPAADAAGVEGMASVDIYYKNTRQFIARKKESDPDRWKDVNL